MTGSTQTLQEARLEKSDIKTILRGSVAEGLFSGATVALAFIGLSGIMPEIMLPAAVIVMGVAFMAEGIAISMRYSKLLAETSKEGLEKAAGFVVGLTAEFLGGVAGTVLGVLALLELASIELVPIAVIVYGFTFMLSSVLTNRLNAVEIEGYEESTRFKKIAHEATTVTAVAEFGLGVGAAVLGIIAITGALSGPFGPVGLLVVGFSGLATGAAVSARMISLFRR